MEASASTAPARTARGDTRHGHPSVPHLLVAWALTFGMNTLMAGVLALAGAVAIKATGHDPSSGVGLAIVLTGAAGGTWAAAWWLVPRVIRSLRLPPLGERPSPRVYGRVSTRVEPDAADRGRNARVR